MNPKRSLCRVREKCSFTVPAIFQRLTIVLLSLCASGCLMLATSAVRSTFPSFDEVRKQWPPIAIGRGRVIIYWPPQSVVEAAKDSVFVNAIVQVNERHKIGLSPGVFIFADLPAERHNFKLLATVFKNVALRNFGGVEEKVLEDFSTEIQEATATYLRIEFKAPLNPFENWSEESLNLVEVPPDIALRELAGTRHNDMNPRSFEDSKQSRGAVLGGGEATS